jgi:hypothetical protein
MKFCRDCNTQNPNAAAYCSGCGRNITSVQMTAPAKDPTDNEEYIPPSAYTRLGGWLKFFVVGDFIEASMYPIIIMLYIFLQVMLAIVPEIATDAGVAMPAFPWQTMFGVLPFAILFASTIMIIRKDSRFLFVRQVGYITSAVYSVAWGVFAGGTSIWMIPVNLAISAVVPTLMTLYFCKSRRVSIYMGNDEYKQKALVKFK